jgi:hypothetical protein
VIGRLARELLKLPLGFFCDSAGSATIDIFAFITPLAMAAAGYSQQICLRLSGSGLAATRAAVFTSRKRLFTPENALGVRIATLPSGRRALSTTCVRQKTQSSTPVKWDKNAAKEEEEANDPFKDMWTEWDAEEEIPDHALWRNSLQEMFKKENVMDVLKDSDQMEKALKNVPANVRQELNALRENPDLSELIGELNSIPRALKKELDEYKYKMDPFINQTSVVPRSADRTEWGDEEDDPDMIAAEKDDTDKFEGDDMTTIAHGKLDEHRERRHYNRITVWEMPLLASEYPPWWCRDIGNGKGRLVSSGIAVPIWLHKPQTHVQ